MHSPSIDEEPRDIGNSMSMLLHTRESTVVIVSYLVHCDIYYIMRWISLKNATKVWYYYKMQQKFDIITKCNKSLLQNVSGSSLQNATFYYTLRQLLSLF